MRLESALALVSGLKRYRDYDCRMPKRAGPYVRQAVIPRASKAEVAEAFRVNSSFTRRRTLWIETAKLKSDQPAIRYRTVRWQLKHFAEMQGQYHKRPTVMLLKSGQPVLWDGNHRASAGILLGKRRIKCMVFS